MNIKRLWRYAPKWVLPTILAVAMPLGAQVASAQALTYTSNGSGKWAGMNEDAYDYRSVLNDPDINAISSAYRGHRWDVSGGAKRDNFWMNPQTGTWGGNFIDYPGSLSSGTSYDGITGETGDTAIILARDTITIDSPLPSYGEFGKIAVLENAGTLHINSYTVGAGTRVTNSGTLNVNGANVHAEGSGLTNTGTVNVNSTSKVTATTVNNAGTINITSSTADIHADVFNNFISTSKGTFSLTDSEVSFDEFNNGNGIINLTNSTLTGTAATSGVDLEDGHAINVTGNSILNGVVSAENELNVVGTTADSKLTMGAVTFTGGTPTLSIAKTQTSLNNTNLANIAAVTAGADARIEGVGFNSTAFTMNEGSWLLPGTSPGTFNVESITFKPGSFLFLEADFDAGTYDKLIAENNIDFAGNGTTTVYVTKLTGDDGDVINSAEFLKADNAGSTGKITVGGSDLASGMVTKVDNVVTVENGTMKVVVQSAKDAAGNDAVEFGTAVVTDKTFGFDTITATDVTPIDPSTPPVTPPGPGPGPAPMQRSSNFETLRDVVNAMGGTDLNAAVGTAVGAAGGTQEAILAIISQLDPVALSLGSVNTQNAVFNFNHTAYDRIRFYTENRYAGTVRGQCDPCEPVACDPCDPCGSFGGRSSARQMWFQGIGGVVNQDDADGIVGHETNTYGFSLGMDRKIARNTVVGFGFGNVYYDTDMNRGMGSANTKTYLLSIYGGHKIGQWQLSGSAGYVMSDLSSNRVASTINGWANGERDADTVFGSFELARRFGNDNGYLTPFLAYDFVNYTEEAYRETGNHLAMSVAEREVDAYIQTLGARLGTKYVNRRGWIVNPGMTLGWIHDYGTGSVRTTGAFNESLNTPFTVVGTSRNKNRALLGFNVDAALSQSLSVFARYDGELAEKYDSHTFQLGLAAQF